ncbi:MAG: DUF1461 domain-containing protein, partial [Actinobacteria bacterium]
MAGSRPPKRPAGTRRAARWMTPAGTRPLRCRMRRDAEGLAIGGATAVALFLAALGLALLPVFSAPAVRLAAGDAQLSERVGLPEDRALEAVELVRRYVTASAPRRLPLSFYGRDGFDDRVTTHLDDVRSVLVGARVATVAACVALLGAFLLARRRGRLADFASGLVAGGIALPVASLLAALFAAVAFDTAFTVFHGLFFESDSWMFAPDDLMVE